MIAMLCTTYNVGVDCYTPNKEATNQVKCRTHCKCYSEI